MALIDLRARAQARVEELRADKYGIVDRTYKRDRRGRFGSGDGSGGPGSGRDLMGSDAGVDLAERIVAVRAAHAGSRDDALSAIAAEQGFDARPRVVDRAEMDRLVRSGSPEMLRGVQPNPEQGKSAEQIHEELRSGDAQFGRGVYGNGYYFAPPGGSGFAGAENFGEGEGAMLRATLDPGAKVVGYRKLREEHDAYFAALGHEPHVPGGLERDRDSGGFRPSQPKSSRDLVFGDLGRFAAARGYDAVEMNDSKSGGYISPQWLVLNRGALIVESAS